MTLDSFSLIKDRSTNKMKVFTADNKLKCYDKLQ